MNFSEQLKEYLRMSGASQKDLAEVTGLSEPMISRFCSGRKEPLYNGPECDLLARGLEELGLRNGSTTPPYAEICRILRGSLQDVLHVDYDIFLSRLNHLMSYMDIRQRDLADGIYSDPSHISRILSGHTRPGNISIFINEVSSFLADRYFGGAEADSVAGLLKMNSQDISSKSDLTRAFSLYLSSSEYSDAGSSAPVFLTQIDEFHLNDYLQSVHFDEIKLPPSAPHLPTRKEYLGIMKMMESEIDFMKTTVLSRSDGDCIMYSDMPLEDMASDPDFPKKYMLGLAMMLKKGLHIHLIHDVHRPFSEMIIGLRNWIPLYMTGQISPYYFEKPQNTAFCHFLKVSGAAALEGSAVAGHQSDGRYVLYRSREDVRHYRKRAEELLSKARPLMDIYRSDKKSAYHTAQKRLMSEGNLRLICSALPVWLLPRELLISIICRAGFAAEISDEIIAYYDDMDDFVINLLQSQRIHITVLAPDGQSTGGDYYAPPISLADLFREESIETTEKEYSLIKAHLNDLTESCRNLSVDYTAESVFRNINICVAGGRTVIVSKEKSPSIHFVIHHRKMVRAFGKFISKGIADH